MAHPIWPKRSRGRRLLVERRSRASWGEFLDRDLADSWKTSPVAPFFVARTPQPRASNLPGSAPAPPPCQPRPRPKSPGWGEVRDACVTCSVPAARRPGSALGGGAIPVCPPSGIRVFCGGGSSRARKGEVLATGFSRGRRTTITAEEVGSSLCCAKLHLSHAPISAGPPRPSSGSRRSGRMRTPHSYSSLVPWRPRDNFGARWTCGPQHIVGRGIPFPFAGSSSPGGEAPAVHRRGGGRTAPGPPDFAVAVTEVARP